MALKDMFRKKYNANVWCNNCNTHSEVSVPKGVTLNQFVDNGACPNCGCATLVADYRTKDKIAEQVNIVGAAEFHDKFPTEVYDVDLERDKKEEEKAAQGLKTLKERLANNEIPELLSFL